MGNNNRNQQGQSNQSQHPPSNNSVNIQPSNTTQVQVTPNSISTQITTAETQTNNEFFKTVTQATIIVLVLTALIYSFTALFKSGYHHYYQLNDYSLLTIDTSDLVHFFLISFPYLLPIIAVYIGVRYAFLIPELLFRSVGVKGVTIFLLIVLVLINPLLYWFLNLNIYNNWYISIWSGIVAIIIFYPFASSKIKNALQAILLPFKPYSVFFILSAFLFLGICSYKLGAFSAKDQKEYSIVTQNEKDFIVISNQGSSLITAPYDKNTNTIKSTFTVIPMKNQVTLKSIKIPKALKVSNKDSKEENEQ